MKRGIATLMLAGGLTLAMGPEPPTDGPSYDSEATRVLVEQMVEAHGGYEQAQLLDHRSSTPELTA